MNNIIKIKARKDILSFLSTSKKKIYPSDLAVVLNIDFDLCLEVIEELLDKREIEIDD